MEIELNKENYNSYPASRRGNSYKDGKLRVPYISVSLPYQIDFWAQDRDSVDDLTKDALFFLTQDPVLKVPFPYISSEMLEVSMDLSSLVNNSEITQASEEGRKYRYTMTVTVEDAKVFQEKKLVEFGVSDVTGLS